MDISLFNECTQLGDIHDYIDHKKITAFNQHKS